MMVLRRRVYALDTPYRLAAALAGRSFRSTVAGREVVLSALFWCTSHTCGSPPALTRACSGLLSRTKVRR